jgi:hypothetical protein
MPLKYQQWITRDDLRANPETLYVFGDNLANVGYGGQAKEMRGEPNAVGIPTKASPVKFLQDGAHLKEVAVHWQRVFNKLDMHLLHGGTVVLPTDGIGTGLADLAKQAPICWALLQAKFKYLNDVDTVYENSK